MMSVVEPLLEELGRCVEAYQDVRSGDKIQRIRNQCFICNAAKQCQRANRLNERLVEQDDLRDRGSAKPGVRQPGHVLQQSERRERIGWWKYPDQIQRCPEMARNPPRSEYHGHQFSQRTRQAPRREGYLPKGRRWCDGLARRALRRPMAEYEVHGVVALAQTCRKSTCKSGLAGAWRTEKFDDHIRTQINKMIELDRSVVALEYPPHFLLHRANDIG